MVAQTDIVPDSERRGLIGALPAAWRPYASLIRLDRPIGAWLLFWPGAWSVALAGMNRHTRPLFGGFAEGEANGWLLIAWLALGAWAMRSAGCVYNDIVDRKLDAQVERTRLRPLASGRVSLTGAWAMLVLLCLIGLVVLLQLGSMAMIVALLSLVFVAAYPFMKRITWWPQAWLGLVFSWAALVGWADVRGELFGVNAQDVLIAPGLWGDGSALQRVPWTMSWAPLWLWLGSVFWVIGYDTIYALQDKEDDALVGVKSSALALGRHARLGIFICYLLAIALWTMAIREVRQEYYAPLALLPMALHLLGQVVTLKLDDGADALAKFRSNRFAGLLMFAACYVVGTA
jgi:4-hydroxybenzoate polyprenyltransferase